MTALNSDDSPVYIKLRGTISAAILRGEYRAGDQLPSVRALGYVEVRRGVGMFVLAGAAEKLRLAERTHFLKDSWPRISAHIKLLGLDAEDLLEREGA